MAHIDDACDLALSRSRLQQGDILFSIAGALGRSAIVTPEILPANTNQALAIIRLKPRPDVFPPFVLKALSIELVADQIEENRGGAAQQNLSLAQIKSFRIPLPSLAEQKRIVAILDEAFASIAKAKANAERNLKNARGLFSAMLRNAFADRGDWEEFELGSRVRFIDYRGKTPPKVDAGVRLITAKNVKMGFIQTTPEEFIPEAAYSAWMTRGIPRRGDVLLTTEAPLGNVAQLDTDE